MLGQLDLFSPSSDPPSQRHSKTSREAAEQIKPQLPRLQQIVLDAIIASGANGLTDEQGVTLTNLSPSTYRPRRIELQTKCLIVDSGKTRPTRSGRQAVIWRAAQ